MKGHVYLVGAGPGDPKLITVRGKEAIEKADVVVYDRLASPRLLQFMKQGARKIYVGKLPDRHTLKQHEINQLLVDLASEGHIVTRLKGGDPSVFGRVGEEAEALVDAGITFDMIPGVTSSIAVPLYAGIPVTHRDFTSSLAIVTGHECPKKEDTSHDWDRLAQATGTMVFLMGVKNIRFLVSQLTANGRSAETPVAVIQWGTSASQRTVTSTLATIETDVAAAGIGSPAVIIIGDVVNLRGKLNWYETKPLFGRRVLVTRARAQASELVERIDALGGEAVELPVIEVTASLTQAAMPDPERWDWIVFTSRNGVEHFFRQLRVNQIDQRRFYRSRVAAIGKATAQALQDYGWLADLCPGQQDREGLWQVLSSQIRTGEQVLLPRGNLADGWLSSQMRNIGATVLELTVYDTVSATGTDASAEVAEGLRHGRIDAVTFTSSSTIRYLLEQLSGAGVADAVRLLNGCKLVCIGPQTATAAAAAGLGPLEVADTSDIEGIVQILCRSFRPDSGV